MNVQVVLYVVRKGRSQKDQEYVMHRKIGTPAPRCWERTIKFGLGERVPCTREGFDPIK
jgi:hypothetical protein